MSHVQQRPPPPQQQHQHHRRHPGVGLPPPPTTATRRRRCPVTATTTTTATATATATPSPDDFESQHSTSQSSSVSSSQSTPPPNNNTNNNNNTNRNSTNTTATNDPFAPSSLPRHSLRAVSPPVASTSLTLPRRLPPNARDSRTKQKRPPPPPPLGHLQHTKHHPQQDDDCRYDPKDPVPPGPRTDRQHVVSTRLVELGNDDDDDDDDDHTDTDTDTDDAPLRSGLMRNAGAVATAAEANKPVNDTTQRPVVVVPPPPPPRVTSDASRLSHHAGTASIGSTTTTTTTSTRDDATSVERTPVRKTKSPDRAAAIATSNNNNSNSSIHPTLLDCPDLNPLQLQSTTAAGTSSAGPSATTVQHNQRRMQDWHTTRSTSHASHANRHATAVASLPLPDRPDRGAAVTGATTAGGGSTSSVAVAVVVGSAWKKATLSRPFGRDDPLASIWPVGVAKWVVEVSDQAEWDPTQHAHTYRILVQRRSIHGSYDAVEPHPTTTTTTTRSLSPPPPATSSFTSAFTWRTMADFQWLADALAMEFHGALLLPRLSVPSSSLAKQQKVKPMQQHHPVESTMLKHWLSDVLNGVRGSGEWLLPVVQQPSLSSTDANTAALPGIDVMKSDSMETFLYRNSRGRSLQDTVCQSPTPLSSPLERGRVGNVGRSASRPLTAASNVPNKQLHPDDGPHVTDDSQCNAPSSFFSTIWTAVSAGTPLELCVGPQFGNSTAASSCSSLPRGEPCGSTHGGEKRFADTKQVYSNKNGPLQRRLQDFSSRALGTAAEFQVQDSFMDGSSSVVSGMSVSSWVGSPRESSALAIHSELLFAGKDLALHYQHSAEAARRKLRVLYGAEENVSAAWKRFAVTLANLFSYEKDAESAHLGDTKIKRENIPFRKVDKETIDECLCVVARQKSERAMPGLSFLKAMLTAYAEDLRSVEPSVEVYAQAIRQLSSVPPSCRPPIIPAEESSNSNQSGGVTASSVSTSSSSNVKQSTGSNGSSWDGLKEWTVKSLTAKVAPVKNDSDAGGKSAHDVAAYALQHEELKQRLVRNERFLRQSLTTMLRTAPFRISRIAWRYWNTEATQCAQLNTAAAELRCKLDVVSQSSVSKLLKRHSKEEKSDCALEMELIQRMVYLGQSKQFSSGAGEAATGGSISTTSINDELVEVDNDNLNEGRANAIKRDKALDIARLRIGRWNAGLSIALMEAVGVDDPNVHVEETTRDLRMVRKYAIGLRECLNRCIESVRILREAITGTNASTTSTGIEVVSLPLDKQISVPSQLKALRTDFLAEMLHVFSGTFTDQGSKSLPKRAVASRTVLFRAGIDTSDPFGWLSTAADEPLPRVSASSSSKKSTGGRGVGALAVQYIAARDAQVEWLLSSLDGLLNEYYQRIEVFEGFVYMECVGIQLEKHFSTRRAKALSAFEKKTDLTAALNMARKKRMTQLVTELQGKLDKLGAEASQTTVKETKEAHLESKNLKTALHELAMRRLVRARETSTERVIAILSLWAKEEEINSTEEIKVLGEAMSTLERSICRDDSLERRSGQ